MRRDHEAAGAASRIADCEFTMRTRIGFKTAHNRFDQHAWREVLARALLAFAGGLFQQAFKCFGFDINVERSPFSLVNQFEHALEIDRVTEARLRPGKDISKYA